MIRLTPLPDWLPRIRAGAVESCIKALKAGRLAKAARILAGEDVAWFGPTCAAGITYVKEASSEDALPVAKCVAIVKAIVSSDGAESRVEALAEKLTATTDPELTVEVRPFRLAEGVSAWIVQFFPRGVGSSILARQKAVYLIVYVVARLDSPWHTMMDVLES